MQQEILTLRKLVNTFKDNIKRYKSNSYDEANARVDFIDKFFELFSWDIRNEQGYSEDFRDVVREDRLYIAGKPKAPDYSFRIGGKRIFFVEAKKPSIYIKEDIVPAFQLRRYAYTAKLPLSILTDFEELAIYDTRIKPDHNDKASTARIFYCTYEEYEEKFGFLYNIISKPAVLKGSFNRYAEENKNKKGTSEVDKEFLKLIEGWRNELAKNIALRNKDLDVYSLNNAVQLIIDRIIFLRIAEDRNTEHYNNLNDITSQKNIYINLDEYFKKANHKYNSGLFKPEKWLSDLIIDDQIIKSIVKSLYYPDCPYELSVLPIEILGNIYEQFLGQTIRLTETHQAKIEEKPEVKKSGGVFYTPQYIVNYIVENTVSEKIKKLTPEQIKEIKILDPACGSGSFLVGTYNFLLNHHLNQYTQPKTIKKALKDAKIYQISENTYRLTILEKQKILTNNIYGVDIDSQAVEVTKLSLLLKLMENEAIEYYDKLFKDFKLLPDLSANIKCGNSIISNDYFNGDNHIINNDSIRSINAFDWKKQFPEVFKNGGFDCVIGNPPYVRQETLGTDFKNYVKDKFKSYAGTADLYVYFFEKAHSLLKENGLFGYISANKWMRANYGTGLRTFIAENTELLKIIDFGELPVFENASTFPAIFITKNAKVKKQKFSFAQIKTLDFKSLDEEIQNTAQTLDNRSIKNENWTLAISSDVNIIEKMKKNGIPLGKYIKNQLFYGIKTGYNEAFIINEEIKQKLILEDPKSSDLIKPFVLGDDIRKYKINFKNRFLIFTRRGININEYPAIENYLKQFKDKLIPKPKDWHGKEWHGRKPGSYQWYEIQDTVDYFKEFEKPKIVYPDIAKESRFAYDNQSMLYANTVYFIPINDLFLLGVLNSKIVFYFFKKFAAVLGDADKGGRLRWFSQDIVKIPIPKKRDDKIIELVKQSIKAYNDISQDKSEHEKSLIKQQIDILDRKINQIVYKLYDLSEQEIVCVEKN